MKRSSPSSTSKGRVQNLGNILLIGTALISLSSCGGDQAQGEVVVSYKDKHLTREYLDAMLPQGLHGPDSARIAESVIREWIEDQAVMDHALAVDPGLSSRIDAKVEDYRAELIKHEFHAKLLRDSLSQKVSAADVEQFHQAHAGELVADEPLFSYIYLSTASDDLGDAVKLLEDSRPESIAELRQWAQANAIESKVDSTYKGISVVHEVSKGYLGELANAPVGKIIRWTGVIQGQRRRYLFKMLSVVAAGDPLPLALCGEQIEQEILNQRKNELIRRADQRIVDQAMRNNDVQRK